MGRQNFGWGANLPFVGTGLGVSAARAIVRQHEGFVTLKSNDERAVDHGTVFTVFLPAIVDRNAKGGEPAPCPERVNLGCRTTTKSL